MVVKVVGADKAARHLRTVEANLRDFSIAYEKIGSFYRSQIMVQFQEHGFIPGIHGPWTPLSENTMRTKDKFKTVPLIASGDLESSLTSRANPYNINEVGIHKARFGTSDPIAIFHQRGTNYRGNPHTPERPILLGNRLLDDYIVKSIADHLFTGWGK